MIQEILEMSYGITDSIEKQLMIIKYDRLIDNGFTQKEAINLLLNNAEINTDDSIITTKEDTMNHGIGVSIIKNIVKKYKGDVVFEDHGETFRVKLFLKNR